MTPIGTASRAFALKGYAVLMGLLASACSGVDTLPVPSVPAPDQAPALYQPAVERETRFQVDDRIAIRSYYDPQFNQELVVRPDGKISPLLLGDVDVLGKTPAELRTLLLAEYTRMAGSPDIIVALADSADLSIYLGGEVKQPSVHRLRGSLTVLQAVSLAGGLLPTANERQILLIRRQPDGALDVYGIDLHKVLRNEMPDVFVQRHDVVYAPRTVIADVNRYVDQYVNGLIPDSVLFNFGWISHRDTGSVEVTSP